MDALCTFFDVPHPTNTKNFNGTAAEEVWIKMDLHQMFVQLLAAVMKYLFPSVYKYQGQAKQTAEDFMEKFRQLDPTVRALVESQFQPTALPASYSGAPLF